MKRYLATSIALIVAILSSNANAMNYSCSGSVSGLTVDPAGNINASFEFTGGNAMSYMTVCSVATVVNTVPVDACKSIYALLLTAKTTQKTVTLWFSGSAANCSATAWGGLKDVGWYWGPMIQ